MKKLKLFLSGGGSAKQTKKFDKFFASKIAGSKRILYIPIAMPARRHSSRECFEWATDTLNSVGLHNIEMWTRISGKQYRKLRDYDAIYIGGGNTYGLLDKIRKTGFDILLKRYLADGGIVYGGSAGAIIMGRNIQTAGFGRDSDRNFLGMKDFRGLNLLGYSIQAHHSKVDDQAMRDYVARTGIPAIALPEETGLYINGDKARVIGYKDAHLFKRNEDRKLKEGSTFKLR